MKARIEKKLSKRLWETAPLLFPKAWKCGVDGMESSFFERTGMAGCWCAGGEYNSWSGDCDDDRTLWSEWRRDWHWVGDFKPFNDGSRLCGWPDTTGFRPTTPNLLRLAAEMNAKEAAAQAKRGKAQAAINKATGQ